MENDYKRQIADLKTINQDLDKQLSAVNVKQDHGFDVMLE